MSAEGAIRVGVFLGMFALVALWELARPIRAQHYKRARRWSNNLGLLVVDILAVRLVAPGVVIAAAATAQLQGFGLLHRVEAPFWVEVLITLLVLDLAIYAQHVVTHKVGWLWRLHRVHHVDPDFDITTGLRFHPFEILISTAYKVFVVSLLGAPALGVLIFEVLLNAGAIFTHANAGIPEKIDHRIRRVLCTPDMHRIHHSPIQAETDSNYGTLLTLWDRLFGTYTREPSLGRQGQEIGLKEFTDARDIVSLPGMLLLPFSKPDR